MTTERVDVLIVGGGPAGLVAARELGKGKSCSCSCSCSCSASLRVVLVERDDRIGAPVRCGEGVGSAGLAEFISPEGAAWVSRRISKVIFWAPDGTEVRVAEGDVGYVLDRTKFEPALAREAVEAGAEIRAGVELTGLREEGSGFRVYLSSERGESEILARLVIAADGVEGMTARWAGLDTRVPAKDMESCAQYVVSGIDFDPDAIYLHFGNGVAPGGYAWIFPKGVGVANVGLGVVALRANGRSARDYLDEYVARHFPRGTITGRTVGGVIVHPTIKRTVSDGLIVCGDAAHMINPLSGGGIVNAMKAGRLAARTAADALAAGDTSAARLQSYHDAWMSMLGDDHIRFHRVKEALGKLDDGFFDTLARNVNRIAPAKRTLGRIFASALVRQPALLPVVSKYFV